MASLRKLLPTKATNERKDKKAEWIHRLEEAVLRSQERELNMDARMQEEIKRQVAL
jgi:hypothetical protein